MNTFVADGQHTAAPERDLAVEVLLECQHPCTLPVQSTLLCTLRLACLYPLPLLVPQTLIRRPYYLQLQAAATARQL